MKKVLSIFLALAMLISLIPAVFAADKVAEPKPYNLFNADATSNTSLKTTTPDNHQYTLSRDIGGTTYYLRDEYWKRYDERGWRLFDASNDTIKTTFRLYATSTSDDKFLQIGQNKNGYFLKLDLALSLEAPETSGFYIPKMKGGSASSTRYEINWNLDLLSSGESTPAYKETADLVFSGSKRRSDAEFNATKAIYSKPEDEIISWMHSDIEHTYGFYYITLDPILEPDMTTVIDNGDDSTSSELSFDLTDGDTSNDSRKVTLTTTVSGKDSSDKAVEDMPVSNNFITYDSSNPLVATVDADGTITAQGGGTATIYAVADKNNTSLDNGITVTVTAPVTEPEEDKPLTDAFKPENSAAAENYSEPVVITVSKDGMDDITSVKNADGTHNITAPETNKNGAKFLYWAKGLTAQKRILIGKTNVLENYAPDSQYANYLIPVYADEVSGTEYYNANGQLIPEATQNTTVSMAGYGTSNGWDKYGDTNIYVAHYQLDEPETNIDVTVINGTGTDTYAFGDTVTCRATGTGTFKCWTKSGINGETEIVSCDETYTFKAWEECTVTAVYEDYNYKGNTSKIIIDSFIAGAETGVMAEFIGLSNAVEKGIMFTDSDKNATKIAMTTKDNQFTVIADENGVYNGYAIVKEENGSYTLITDGSYEHTK